ncbi:MAG: PH domain-containing protein [Nitrospira sp.]|nr:PH domain-containing protein [Nitrospira sp.]
MTIENSDTEIFRSRRDMRSTIFVWGTSLLIWFFGYCIIASSGPLGERLFGASIVFLIGSIAPWLWLTTGYWITQGTLHLKSGMLHKELKLSDIREVTYTKQRGGCSFAFSRQGLYIEVEGSDRGYRVSPMDRSKFVEELEKRCDNLKVITED